MKELYSDLARLKEMGDNGRRAVETNCTEEKYYSEITNVYRAVSNAGPFAGS